MSPLTIIAICVVAGLVGAVLGPAISALLRQSISFGVPRKRRRRRRRTSYYFSDDDRSWSDRRWRRLAFVLSVGAVIALLMASSLVALANYKTRPNAAAGYRR